MIGVSPAVASRRGACIDDLPLGTETYEVDPRVDPADRAGPQSLTTFILRGRDGALIPLAASIAFGLAAATSAALFLVPAVYAILDDLQALGRCAGRKTCRCRRCWRAADAHGAAVEVRRSGGQALSVSRR